MYFHRNLESFIIITQNLETERWNPDFLKYGLYLEIRKNQTWIQPFSHNQYNIKNTNE